MFSSHRLLGIRLALCVLLSLVLMTVDHRKDYLESVRGYLSSAVYPIQYVVNLPVKFGSWASEELDSRQSLLEENERLKKQNLLLKARTHKFQSLESENQRLRDLASSNTRHKEKALVADLLAVELDSTTHKFVLNKGEQEGVYLGQPIVDVNGVMGQIVHVGKQSSTGLMVIDQNHAIPIEVNRSGIRAIAIGLGHNNEMFLDYVPPDSDIKPQDLIVTSGLGDRFPKGYPVGRVLAVESVPGESFMRVRISPVSLLSKTREVLLLWPGVSPTSKEQGRVVKNEIK